MSRPVMSSRSTTSQNWTAAATRGDAALKGFPGWSGDRREELRTNVLPKLQIRKRLALGVLQTYWPAIVKVEGKTADGEAGQCPVPHNPA